MNFVEIESEVNEQKVLKGMHHWEPVVVQHAIANNNIDYDFSQKDFDEINHDMKVLGELTLAYMQSQGIPVVEYPENEDVNDRLTDDDLAIISAEFGEDYGETRITGLGKGLLLEDMRIVAPDAAWAVSEAYGLSKRYERTKMAMDTLDYGDGEEENLGFNEDDFDDDDGFKF